MGLDTPPALAGAGERDGRGGRNPPMDVGALGGTECLARGYFGGSAPLPPGAARPADSPHYTWGRMRRGCFFPLETFRPALRAGVGDFGGCGHAAFGALAGYVAHCAAPSSHVVPRAKRSNARSAAGKAIRRRDDHLRHAETRKRQPPPPTRTKAVFSLESEGFLFDKTKRNLSEAPSREPSLSAARSASASLPQPGLRNWRGEGAVLGGGGRFSGAYTRWR